MQFKNLCWRTNKHISQNVNLLHYIVQKSRNLKLYLLLAMLAIDVSTSPAWGVTVGFITSPRPSNTTAGRRCNREGRRWTGEGDISILHYKQFSHSTTTQEQAFLLLGILPWQPTDVSMTTAKREHWNVTYWGRVGSFKIRHMVSFWKILNLSEFQSCEIEYNIKPSNIWLRRHLLWSIAVR